MVKAKRAKVVICVPSGDMVHADFMMSLIALLFHSSALVDVRLISAKGSLITDNRNNGVVAARKHDATHLMFIDSDMIVPADALVRLLAHRKDVVGACYPQRNPPYRLHGRGLDGKESWGKGLVEMSRLPTGCMLIDMAVFDASPKPAFHLGIQADGQVIGEDYLFCDGARASGFRVWCDYDLSAEVAHLGLQPIKAGDVMHLQAPEIREMAE